MLNPPVTRRYAACNDGAVESVDFVVVGAGIAGASVGYELAARGTVFLVEQEPVAGYHTTGRSAAAFTETYERGPVRALSAASRAFLSGPPPGFTETEILAPMPVLYVGDDERRGSVETLAAGARGVPGTEILDGPAMRDLCPVLRESATIGLIERGAMEIDVHALHQGFLHGLRERGGAIRTGAPVSTLAWNAGVWTVEAGPNTIACGVVVNAAGAWCDEIAALAGVRRLGLTPMRRTAFTFAPPEGLDISTWPMVIDAEERFYFKPERTHLLGSLAEETPMHPHDVRPEEIDVARAIERIQQATLLDIRHVQRTWAGLRTFAPDRHPVVGFDPDATGFFWLGGQGGFGIMTSPALGRVAAGLACGEGIPADIVARGLVPEDLAPDRLVADTR